MKPYESIQGDGPIVLGMPHTGLDIPPHIANSLSDVGLAKADTDWNIHQLYDGLLPDASFVRATFHRYVIDANRPPSGDSLYPGQNTTGLCPLTDFDGLLLYKEGAEPGPEEIERRREQYHAPYHQELERMIARAKARHGFAVLFDCHSIRSNIPFLFDGTLPDFNIGTNGGTSCAGEIETAVHDVCRMQEGASCVLNGRFKGGWTTRHYGRPEQGIHAVQMELAQSLYMDEKPPWAYREEQAEATRAILKACLTAVHSAARILTRKG